MVGPGGPDGTVGVGGEEEEDFLLGEESGGERGALGKGEEGFGVEGAVGHFDWGWAG